MNMSIVVASNLVNVDITVRMVGRWFIISTGYMAMGCSMKHICTPHLIRIKE
jgi:hypothetical protein